AILQSIAVQQFYKVLQFSNSTKYCSSVILQNITINFIDSILYPNRQEHYSFNNLVMCNILFNFAVLEVACFYLTILQSRTVLEVACFYLTINQSIPINFI